MEKDSFALNSKDPYKINRIYIKRRSFYHSISIKFGRRIISICNPRINFMIFGQEIVGVQLIFVVETNKKCNSDWIYIKETIEHFYLYDRIKVKLSVVYMDGRGNYSSNKKERTCSTSLQNQTNSASWSSQYFFAFSKNFKSSGLLIYSSQSKQ